MWMSIEAIHLGVSEKRDGRPDNASKKLEPHSPTRIEKQEEKIKRERREIEKSNGARPKITLSLALFVMEG